jgi:epoxide hydrolase-like protein
MLGLAVAFKPATIGEAFAESRIAGKEDTMTRSSATHRGSEQAADKTTIRPFQVNVPEAELTGLRRRINSTRWPDRETVTDESQRCAACDNSGTPTAEPQFQHKQHGDLKL